MTTRKYEDDEAIRASEPPPPTRCCHRLDTAIEQAAVYTDYRGNIHFNGPGGQILYCPFCGERL